MRRVCLLLVFFCLAINAEVTDDDAESGSGALEPSTSTVVVTPELRAEESANAMKAQEALMKGDPVDMEEAVDSISQAAKAASQEVTNALNDDELKDELEAEEKAESDPELESKIMEGDILIPEGQTKEQFRKSIKTNNGKREIVANKKWDVVIPYQIPRGLNKQGQMIKAINEAIIEITAKIGCIKFVQRFNDGKSNNNKQKNGKKEDFIKFIQDKGCYSVIGKESRYQGRGQPLSLGKGCEHKGTAIHEIMHALGFWHEHSRFDRDRYVKVNFQHIKQDKKSNFDKYPKKTTGIDKFFSYDYGSIMHYPDWAFSKNGRSTITVRKRGQKIGQRKAMSRTDIAQIKYLYCKNAVPIREYVKHPNFKNNKYVAMVVE